MRTLVVTDPTFDRHVTPAGHPERVERLVAVRRAWQEESVAERLDFVPCDVAPLSTLELVHSRKLIDHIEQVAAGGGGALDPDTSVVPASWNAALGAVGATVTAARAVLDGSADGSADGSTRAFCAVRPPGHHATPNRAMGFCLFNNVAIAARTLTGMGERVAVVDIDVHHGNGTQDVFIGDPAVLFVSLHQSPHYPGTGAVGEIGVGDGRGTTVNIPLPAGSAGAVYRVAWDLIGGPALDAFAPTVVLISAGFDTHRADPLASMQLSSGDVGRLVESILDTAPVPTVAVLEGGYDLNALTMCTRSVLGALTGDRIEDEAPTDVAADRDAALTIVERLGRDRDAALATE